MVTLEAAIAGLIAGWNGDTTVEQRVFASGDPAAIAACLDAACRDVLGAGVAGSLFAEKSVGIVVGLRLEDGRDVVVKAHQPWQRTLEQHAACVRVQAALHAAAPASRSSVTPTGASRTSAFTTAESPPSTTGTTCACSPRWPSPTPPNEVHRSTYWIVNTQSYVPVTEPHSASSTTQLLAAPARRRACSSAAVHA